MQTRQIISTKAILLCRRPEESLSFRFYSGSLSSHTQTV